MRCNNDYCDFEKSVTVCPRCGAAAVLTVKTLTAWVRCPKCGRITTGADASEALEKWEAQDGQ